MESTELAEEAFSPSGQSRAEKQTFLACGHAFSMNMATGRSCPESQGFLMCDALFGQSLETFLHYFALIGQASTRVLLGAHGRCKRFPAMGAAGTKVLSCQRSCETTCVEHAGVLWQVFAALCKRSPAGYIVLAKVDIYAMTQCAGIGGRILN